MDNINSTTRFSDITQKIILTQTDTTVGFLSQNGTKLAQIKSRPPTKQFIKVYKNFKSLSLNKIRLPNKQKNYVRRAKQSSFIIKTQSFRVASPTLHSTFLQNLSWNYSTSANESGKKFLRNFCEEKADIIIEDKIGLYENKASKLYKINNKKRVRLR